jgi:2-methylisocitrate lyase-like PEP mutase family enzyme
MRERTDMTDLLHPRLASTQSIAQELAMSDRLNTFRQLHAKSQLLRLPNAWDAGSARLFESLGARAIATSSAGVAWALGYPDGSKMPSDVAVGLAASIARVLTVPLSIDLEDGYSDDPDEVAKIALRLIDAGVVGINLEDGGKPATLLATKIERIKNVAAQRGVDLFVNARTDVFLASLVADTKRVAETLARGALYRSAGADGLFVPALVQPAQIRAIVEGIELPVNVLAWQGLPNATELAELGIRRLSAGSGISQVLWAQAEKLAKGFLDEGRSDALEGQMPYPRLQGLF